MLQEQDSDSIKELIESKEPDFLRYVRRIGLQPTNVYAILSGRRPCTPKFLRNLLDPLNLSIEVTSIYDVVDSETGPDVQDVPSTKPGNVSPSGEPDTSSQKSIDPFGDFDEKVPIFSSLEKPLDQ